MTHTRNVTFTLVASFLVALVVTSSASAGMTKAYATGGHGNYDDDYVKNIIKKWLLNHLNDDDREEAKEKLKDLIVYDVECNQAQGVGLPLDTQVECEASVTLKDHDIFDKFPILKKFLINILVNDLHITVTDPSGEVAFKEDIKQWWDNKQYDSDSDYGEKTREFSFVLTQPGQYTMDVEFTKFCKVVKTFESSFYVLPESPVGALAMVGSSLAALGGFFGLRKFRN
jgi:hypothetical protein